MEEPLDGLAVGLVAELPRQLEYPGGAGGRHADPAAAAVDLGVSVLGGGSLRRRLLGLLREVEAVVVVVTTRRAGFGGGSVVCGGGTRLFR